jgi:hypothetical protein
MSLPQNLIDTWDCLEQRFHDYFYIGESELRLSYIVAVEQKSNKTVADYMRRFRDTHNKCYGLTIGEKDTGRACFSSDVFSIEGQDFVDVNQVLKHAMRYESRAREHKAFSSSRKSTAKTSHGLIL